MWGLTRWSDNLAGYFGAYVLCEPATWLHWDWTRYNLAISAKIVVRDSRTYLFLMVPDL